FNQASAEGQDTANCSSEQLTMSGADKIRSPQELTHTNTILAEVKSVASRVNGMDESVGARLDGIDGTLSEIKISITSVEESLSSLSNRASQLEKRAEEAEERISAAEDRSEDHSSRLAAMEKTVERLLLKVDDLENRSRCNNLKIINLPEGAEGSTSLVDFLQSALPALVDLPADFPSLEIERAHRALAPAPDPGKPPRSVLVRFLRFSQREAVLRAALKKRDIRHGGSQLRFYPDLSSEVLALARLNKYRGFAYPARLRCLHEGRILLFDTPESAAVLIYEVKTKHKGCSDT
uniref:L1 transposable element RRM domain-containing protein n=1 Tax=Xiphophorus couchianus TaxID=32473 RepID=A0A3B5LHZ3_9TELE